MASTHDDRPPSSLSDSWTSLSNPDLHSEDDTRSESTDTASLVGQTGPDDVLDLEDAESSSEAGSKDQGRDISESQEIDSNAFPIQPSLHSLGSTITPRASIPESIEFEEPERWPAAEQVELKHTVHIFSEDEVTNITGYDAPELFGHQMVATARMTMTREDLRLSRPFRILYLGGSPEIKNAILTKLGDALIANAGIGSTPALESSMYHVLQTSYHPGASPTELVPIDAQLVVDECVGATSQKIGFRQADNITLTFKKGQSWSSVWQDNGYTVSSKSQWMPPDIAVFFISDHETIPDRQSRTYAHHFMNRHNIPTMMISERFLWQGYKGVMPFDHKSLHGCLESRASNRTDTRVLKRLPIDLNTFQSIAPTQLNRNLACLTGLYKKKSTNMTSSARIEAFESPTLQSLSDIEKHPLNKSIYSERYSLSRLQSSYVIWGAFLSVVALALLHVLTGQYPSPSLTPRPIATYSSPASTTLKTTATSNYASLGSTAPFTSTGVPLVADSKALPKVLATIDPKRELQNLLTPEIEAVNKSDEFQVYVVGDCHMIIKPPKHLASMKRPPTFDVRVMRRDQVLSHNLSKLFEGVYTAQLEREDAYGPVNVTISTRTRPILTQVTGVDFGTPWLKIAGWKKAAQIVSAQVQKDLSTAQVQLAVAYQRVSADLQVRLHEASKKAEDLRREGGKITQVALKYASIQSTAVAEVAKVQGIAASRRMTKEIAVTSKHLASQVRDAKREVAVFVKDAWQSAYRKGLALQQTSSMANFSLLKETLQDAKKSKVLAKAQERASTLLKDSSVLDTKPEPPASKSKKSHKKKGKNCGACGRRNR